MTWRLEARALSRRKPDGSWLIRDVSMVLSPGDRVGVVGESGTGKTVLLRALAALDPLESGALWWSNNELSGDAFPQYRSRVVYLHQRPMLVEGSVEHNLAFPFTLRIHERKAFDRARAVFLLERLGKSAAFLAKLQSDLSGGEAQIAALARALLIDPCVLLLDEPTASLDARSATLVEGVLQAWLDERGAERGLVYVSHRPDSLTDRRLRMHEGTLTEGDA